MKGGVTLQYHKFDGEFLHNLIRLDYDYKNECVLKSGKPVRGVILGDSIIQYLQADVFFKTDDILMRGINGETSAQVLSRLETDVLQFHPEFAVILCGINDTSALRGDAIWRVPAKSPEEITKEICRNLTEIVSVLNAHNIKPYVCSLLPSCVESFPANDERNQIVCEVNDILKTLDCCYLDIHSRFPAPKELTNDGLHPNYSGYRIFTDVLIENGLVEPADF